MEEILVFPRELIRGLDGLVVWNDAKSLVSEASEHMAWMPRERAEVARDWVQPIPCAIFYDDRKQYCVFCQSQQNRKDLSLRLSFIVGGHIETCSSGTLITEIFSDTVKREVQEEIGITLGKVSEPLGMVVDASSLSSSRHVGFVYEVRIDGGIKTNTEFAIHSKYNGVFINTHDILHLKGQFDPWSTILLSEYINRKLSPDLGRQSMLPLFDDM